MTLKKFSFHSIKKLFCSLSFCFFEFCSLITNQFVNICLLFFFVKKYFLRIYLEISCKLLALLFLSYLSFHPPLFLFIYLNVFSINPFLSPISLFLCLFVCLSFSCNPILYLSFTFAIFLHDSFFWYFFLYITPVIFF